MPKARVALVPRRTMVDKVGMAQRARGLNAKTLRMLNKAEVSIQTGLTATGLDEMATGSVATGWKKSQDGASGAPTVGLRVIGGACAGDQEGVVGGIGGQQECVLSPELGEEWDSLWDALHI